jgi:hypothetical protein
MNTLQEAIEKSKSISNEIGEVLDTMNQFQLGQKGRLPTKQEWDELQMRLDELEKTRRENYEEINRLSNGAIHISKNGTKLTIRKKKT